MTATPEALLSEVPDPGQEERAAAARPTLAAARACVNWMSAAVHRLNRRIGVQAPAALLVHDLVLAGASETAVFWLRGRSEQAKTSLLLHWIWTSLLLRSICSAPPELDSGKADPSWKHLSDVLSASSQTLQAVGLESLDLDREFLLVFNTAVRENLAAHQADSEARQTLRQLMSQMDLSVSDLARMLDVSLETVEQWESGGITIPTEPRALLARASSALATLASIFRPERLPQVIRQQVELFDGQSAYDWILQGRIQEVADRYETAFAYQG